MEREEPGEVEDPKHERKEKSMSDEKLALLLEGQNKIAIGYLSDAVSAKQDDNLDRYLGEPYGDEEEGSSNAMSMDVAEVVDWALPDLLEPFIAGDHVVEYEPATQADEAWVDQATDLANYTFYKDNKGVVILHDVIKTACIQKIGVIKTVWEDEDKTEEQTMTGLPIIAVQELQQDKSLKVVSIEAEPIDPSMLDQETAQAFLDGKVYTVEVERTKRGGCNRLYSVPPEQFKVSQRVDDLDKAEYCCHETEVRRYELLDMGFDADLVAGLKETHNRDTNRSDKRFSDEQRNEQTNPDPASDILTLCEEYYRCDANGDGKSELLQVFRCGKTILDRDEVTSNPFDTWSADRIPNRLIGLALADKVKQTQKIKTHLTRQMLDNVYLSNNPRIEVPDQATGTDTIEDLLTYRIGGLIRTKGPGGQMRPIEVPDRSAVALGAIQYMDSVREQQSGITKNGMSLGSEAIDGKSATQTRKEDRNESGRKRLMTRMIAETLLVPVFRKLLRNIVMYQDFERTIKLRGKWVKMDPRGWHADLSASAATGLGHANKDEQLQAAMALLNVQQQAQPLGLVTEKHLYKGAEKLCQALGYKQPEELFLNPDSEEGKQVLQARSQQPNPKMLEVQGKQQIAQAALQGKQQQANAELQFKSQLQAMQSQFEQQKAIGDQKFAMQKHFIEQQAKAAFDQGKAQADMQAQMVRLNLEHQADMTKIAAEAQLAREQMQAEFDLSREQMIGEMEIAREKNSMMAKSKPSMGNGVRMGGKVG